MPPMTRTSDSYPYGSQNPSDRSVPRRLSAPGMYHGVSSRISRPSRYGSSILPTGLPSVAYVAALDRPGHQCAGLGWAAEHGARPAPLPGEESSPPVVDAFLADLGGHHDASRNSSRSRWILCRRLSSSVRPVRPSFAGNSSIRFIARLSVNQSGSVHPGAHAHMGNTLILGQYVSRSSMPGLPTMNV